MLIHADFQDNKNNSSYYQLLPIIKQLTHKQEVEFALYCAKDVFHFNTEQSREFAELCIGLVERWLEDNFSVTEEESRDAADSIWNYGGSHCYAALAAGWAVRTTTDVKKFHSARCAAAAVNEHYYVNLPIDNKKDEYLVIANSYFTTTNTTQPFIHLDQKIIYLIDELDENLIIQNDGLYFLNMNGITRCPHLGCKSQDELIDNILNSEETYWWFCRRWINRLYP